MSITKKEFQINDYLSLKLENKNTITYVGGKVFIHCKYLLLKIPTEDLSLTEEIDSIDEETSKLKEND